ncbi:hypothetical protein F4814DRAFT_415515 [Daldinia grandis]|nr:hypothetical protein F4814DRAFT_415515 [Daldinia grandis]
MPRVRDSLSIYKTPVFPLPKNYKPYSADDRPKVTYYPQQLVGSQKLSDISKRPESVRSVRSVRSAKSTRSGKSERSGKGKEPEYIPPPSSIPPVPKLPYGQYGITSSNGKGPMPQ